jgi:mRNA interferase MazF
MPVPLRTHEKAHKARTHPELLWRLRPGASCHRGNSIDCRIWCGISSTYGNHPGCPRRGSAPGRGWSRQTRPHQSFGADSKCPEGALGCSACPRTGGARPGGILAPSRQCRLNLGAGGVVAGRLARGEIRLYRCAAPDKQRPVLVLTRESAIDYLSSVTVAPITSTIRGVPSEVVLTEEDGMKSPCAVNLHNVVTVSKEHLGRRVGKLSAQRLAEVCAGLGFVLGCA